MDFQFFKYHALGNDYIVIDPNKTQIKLDENAIRLICHRNFGIGSDGILYGPIWNNQRISLKIFNPDGSEAEKSGNGIRIFSRYLLDTKYITQKQFALDTLGGTVQVELLDDKGSSIRVDMGTVTFFSSYIPVSGPDREVVNESLVVENQQLTVTCVSIGNPHCVIVGKDQPIHDMAVTLGPLIENHPQFPNKINVQFVNVLDRKNIDIEIWERGAGYTLASGSSSCAAANASYKLGLVDSELTVHMPGGEIAISIQPDGHVFMSGSVTSVSRGVFDEDLWQKIHL